MARIPDGELCTHSSTVLRAVQGGETIEVTDNGEVAAVLVPPPRGPRAHLRIRRATERCGLAELPRAHLAHPVRDDPDELRGDDR